MIIRAPVCDADVESGQLKPSKHKIQCLLGWTCKQTSKYGHQTSKMPILASDQLCIIAEHWCVKQGTTVHDICHNDAWSFISL
jgi:ribulose-5-phosphate 4-epimerase/fuculose-1-phosphate aldolase